MVRFASENSKTKKLRGFRPLARFLKGNRKIYSFDLLAGWSCPFAKDCLSRAAETNDGLRIVDGPNTEFRCFSASQEARLPNVYKSRKANYDAIKAAKTTEGMTTLLLSALPKNLGICRIHVSGDFFNLSYFQAWINVANTHKNKLFYTYTKSLPYWQLLADQIPYNLVLTASYGGRYDHLIDECGFRSAKVVYSRAEAIAKGLKIDYTDRKAANPQPKARQTDFALLIHGSQPKGSDAAKAWDKIRREKMVKA